MSSSPSVYPGDSKTWELSDFSWDSTALVRTPVSTFFTCFAPLSSPRRRGAGRQVPGRLLFGATNAFFLSSEGVTCPLQVAVKRGHADRMQGTASAADEPVAPLWPDPPAEDQGKAKKQRKTTRPPPEQKFITVQCQVRIML